MGSAVPELTAAAQALQQRYDTSLHYQDMLDQGIQQSTATSADTQMLQDLKTKYRDRLRDFAKRGDYENMVRESHRAARDFANEYKPLADNVQLQSAYKKELDEKVSKGDIDPLTAERLWDYSIRSYKGLQRDPRTGQMVNQFRGMASVKNINLPEWVDKALVGITDTKTGSTIRKDVNGYYVESGSKREYLKWDRIKPVLDAAKASDPNFQAWASQQALINSYQADHIPDEAIMTSSLYPELKAEAEKRGVKPQQVLKEMYANRALQNIDQSINAFGSKYLKDNYESTYKVMGETEETKRVRDAELADKIVPIYGNITLASAGTQFNSPAKLKTAREDVVRSLDTLVRSNMDFIQRNNITRNAKGEYVMPDGTDVTGEVVNNLAMEEQARRTIRDLNERELKAQKQAGYDPSKMDPKLLVQAQRVYDAALAGRPAQSTPGGYIPAIPGNKEIAQKAYDDFLQARNLSYGKYIEVMKADAEKGSVTVGVKGFSSDKATKAVNKMFEGLALNLDKDGLKSGALGIMKVDGTPFTDEDYAKIKGKAEFVGNAMDPTTKQVTQIFKVGHIGESKGELTGEQLLVRIPAMGGTIAQMIKEGDLSTGQATMMQSLQGMGESGKLDIPLSDKDMLTIVKATNTQRAGMERGAGTQDYTVRYNVGGKKLEKQMTLGELINTVGAQIDLYMKNQ